MFCWYMCLSTTSVPCLRSHEEGAGPPRTQSYGQLLVVMWILGIELWSFGRSSLNWDYLCSPLVCFSYHDLKTRQELKSVPHLKLVLLFETRDFKSELSFFFYLILALGRQREVDLRAFKASFRLARSIQRDSVSKEKRPSLHWDSNPVASPTPGHIHHTHIPHCKASSPPISHYYSFVSSRMFY